MGETFSPGVLSSLADAASAGPKALEDPAKQPSLPPHAPCNSDDSERSSKRLCQRDSVASGSSDAQGSILSINTRLLAAGILPLPAPADASGTCDTSLLVSSKVLKAALAVQEGRKATPWFGGGYVGTQPGPAPSIRPGLGQDVAPGMQQQQQQPRQQPPPQQQQQQRKRVQSKASPVPPPAAASAAARRGPGFGGPYKQQQQYGLHPHPGKQALPPLSAMRGPTGRPQMPVDSQQQWQQHQWQQRQVAPHPVPGFGDPYGAGGYPGPLGPATAAAGAGARGNVLRAGLAGFPSPILCPPSIMPQDLSGPNHPVPGPYHHHQQQQQIGGVRSLPGASPGLTASAPPAPSSSKQQVVEGGTPGGVLGALPPPGPTGSPVVDLSDHSSGTVMPGLDCQHQQQQGCWLPPQRGSMPVGAAPEWAPHARGPLGAPSAAAAPMGPGQAYLVPPPPAAASAAAVVAMPPPAGPSAAMSQHAGRAPAAAAAAGVGTAAAPAELLSRVGGPEAFLELLQQAEASEPGAAARLLQQWGLSPPDLLQLLQQVLEGQGGPVDTPSVPPPPQQQQQQQLVQAPPPPPPLQQQQPPPPLQQQQQRQLCAPTGGNPGMPWPGAPPLFPPRAGGAVGGQAALPPPPGQASLQHTQAPRVVPPAPCNVQPQPVVVQQQLPAAAPPPGRQQAAQGTAGKHQGPAPSLQGPRGPGMAPCDLLPGRSRKRDSLAALQAAATSSRLQLAGGPK